MAFASAVVLMTPCPLACFFSSRSSTIASCSSRVDLLLLTAASRDSLRLAHDHLVRELRVPLRRLDRGVPENLLQRRQTSSALEPLAREGVSHLVCMEPLDTRPDPDRLGERTRRQHGEADQLSHAPRHFIQQRHLQRHPAHPANKYIDDLRQNVTRGNRERFRRGWPNFRPPVGYLEDRATKTVIKDPERFDLMRRAWDLVLSGAMRPSQVLHVLNDQWQFRTRRTAR